MNKRVPFLIEIDGIPIERKAHEFLERKHFSNGRNRKRLNLYRKERKKERKKPGEKGRSKAEWEMQEQAAELEEASIFQTPFFLCHLLLSLSLYPPFTILYGAIWLTLFFLMIPVPMHWIIYWLIYMWSNFMEKMEIEKENITNQ